MNLAAISDSGIGGYLAIKGTGTTLADNSTLTGVDTGDVWSVIDGFDSKNMIEPNLDDAKLDVVETGLYTIAVLIYYGAVATGTVKVGFYLDSLPSQKFGATNLAATGNTTHYQTLHLTAGDAVVPLVTNADLGESLTSSTIIIGAQKLL